MGPTAVLDFEWRLLGCCCWGGGDCRRLSGCWRIGRRGTIFLPLSAMRRRRICDSSVGFAGSIGSDGNDG